MGRVSKILIQNIVDNLKTKLGLNLWISTSDAINWFDKIQNKSRATFIQFDIVEFYPSIKENMLLDAIKFAKEYINIAPADIDLIMACRNNILMHNNEVWKKITPYFNGTNSFSE